MTPRTHALRMLLWTALASGGVAALHAQLVSNSPFMAPQASGPGPTQGAPLEYRGYVSTPEGTQYVIYDPTRKLRSFLKVNERDSTLDVVVKQFDPNNDQVTIEYQGKTLTLEERKSKIVSSGNAAAMAPTPMPAQPAPQVMPAVTQSVVVNPTPAEEQKRLEAVAAEVARRRALREQAQQNMPQQVAIPAVQPQTQPQMQPQVEAQRRAMAPQTQPGAIPSPYTNRPNDGRTQR